MRGSQYPAAGQPADQTTQPPAQPVVQAPPAGQPAGQTTQPPAQPVVQAPPAGQPADEDDEYNEDDEDDEDGNHQNIKVGRQALYALVTAALIVLGCLLLRLVVKISATTILTLAGCAFGIVFLLPFIRRMFRDAWNALFPKIANHTSEEKANTLRPLTWRTHIMVTLVSMGSALIMVKLLDGLAFGLAQVAGFLTWMSAFALFLEMFILLVREILLGQLNQGPIDEDTKSHNKKRYQVLLGFVISAIIAVATSFVSLPFYHTEISSLGFFLRGIISLVAIAVLMLCVAGIAWILEKLINGIRAEIQNFQQADRNLKIFKGLFALLDIIIGIFTGLAVRQPLDSSLVEKIIPWLVGIAISSIMYILTSSVAIMLHNRSKSKAICLWVLAGLGVLLMVSGLFSFSKQAEMIGKAEKRANEQAAVLTAAAEFRNKAEPRAKQYAEGLKDPVAAANIVTAANFAPQIEAIEGATTSSELTKAVNNFHAAAAKINETMGSNERRLLKLVALPPEKMPLEAGLEKVSRLIKGTNTETDMYAVIGAGAITILMEFIKVILCFLLLVNSKQEFPEDAAARQRKLRRKTLSGGQGPAGNTMPSA